MGETITSGYVIVKKVIGPRFDAEKLSIYTLSIQIGISDLQICVINKQTGRCLLIEDYQFENVRTINDRLEAVKQLIQRNKLTSSQDWGTIKLSLKTHKFSLVPANYFLSENSSDYLTLNAEINPRIEEIYYYRHISCSAVNLFSVDNKLIHWINEFYPKKQVQVVSQSCALIEGILQHDDHTTDKSMFCLVDKGIFHVVVTQNKKLVLYNQFAVRKKEDYLKYIMLVFKETNINPKTGNVTIWGGVSPNASIVDLLKRYIRNISLGSKPGFLKFDGDFNELPDHQYFDAYSIFLCE